MDTAESKQAANDSISGKLVIALILSVALLGAGVSWYFRYTATHRAAQFWGTGSTILIRDASQVVLHVPPSGGEAESTIDVSKARGLTYLRNALLEDHNFEWPELDEIQAADVPLEWKWVLEFRDPKDNKTTSVQFTKDCTLAARVASSKERGSVRTTVIRTDAIMAKGLRDMFGEFTGVMAIGELGSAAQGQPGQTVPAKDAR